MTELIPATEAELAATVAAPARIAIVGCGAMGSVYAARLAEAGHTVTAISRRADHIDAIETTGLRISGPDGERVVRLRASQSVPDEPMDLVVVAVKAAGVAGLAETIGPLIDKNTVVMALQIVEPNFRKPAGVHEHVAIGVGHIEEANIERS